MFVPEQTVLLIVDVQGNLARVMHNRDMLFAGLQKLITGVRVLNVPVLWMEQNPKGLGPTIPEIAALLTGITPISKMSFSCCRNASFMSSLQSSGREQILMAGIEAHICIYQSAVGLLNLGYQVDIVTDAVSSRTAENKEIGLQKMKDAGAGLTSVETVLFELLCVAEDPRFKEIIKIVK